MVELVEFRQHFFYFWLKLRLGGTGETSLEFKVVRFQQGGLLGKGVFLEEFRDIVDKEEQLAPVVRPILEGDDGLDELESGVKLLFLQSEDGFEKNSLLIVITVIDGPVHSLVAVGVASHQSQDAGQRQGQLWERHFFVRTAHVQREQVEVGGVVEVVKADAGLQVGKGEFQLVVAEVRDGSVGVIGGSGGVQQDDVVQQRQADGVVPLPVHLRRLLEQTAAQLLSHSLRKIIIQLYTVFQTAPSSTSSTTLPPLQQLTPFYFLPLLPLSSLLTLSGQHSINLQPAAHPYRRQNQRPANPRCLSSAKPTSNLSHDLIPLNFFRQNPITGSYFSRQTPHLTHCTPCPPTPILPKPLSPFYSSSLSDYGLMEWKLERKEGKVAMQSIKMNKWIYLG